MKWEKELKKSALKPFGQTDCLPYYIAVASKLRGFLKDKMLSTKILIPNGPKILKRGSEIEPLYVDELAQVGSESFWKLRKKHLDEVRAQLSPLELKAWTYFYPRKYAELLYATNGEGVGLSIERIFFDIDRKGRSAKEAQLVARELARCILTDLEFNKLVGAFKLQAAWTGKSFHLYVLLENPIDREFYEEHLQFSKNNPMQGFAGKWSVEIFQKLDIPITGGHEKVSGFITIDPSQTPSGKLCRAPFSLHVKDGKIVDGVCVPLKVEMLSDKKLLSKLEKLSPEKVLKDLNVWAKNLTV
ncbi:MAG: hypothetical protein V1847_01540 [Candidatus Diapherotrites archaeon]